MTDSLPGYVGRPVPRREDERLLLGRGAFVADMRLPRMLHVAFARSDLPHARIASIDLEAARSAEGVAFAASGPDLGLPPIDGMQVTTPQGWRDRVETDIVIPDQPLLPADKVRYVGEAYALIVAEDRYLAEDALELIDAALEPLPAAPDPEAALRDGAPLVHEDLGRNVAARLRAGKGGEASAPPRRLRRRFVHHRYAAMPLECRGVVAEHDPRTDTLTVWSSTQVVHWVRREVAAALGMPEERVRCIAPDVGGGFGGKGHVYPEDVLIPCLARRLGRPVKWVEDRHEHMLNAAHSRDNVYDVEIGFDDDGRILSVRTDFTVDSGAYTPVGAGIAGNSIAHMLGPYDIPNYEAECRVVLTNRAPNAPYRGAGRPEVVFAMERAVDLVARELGIEPAELRLRNMIPPERMPYEVGLAYRDGVPIVYDSGDYPGALRRALDELGGLERFRERQEKALAEGRYLGIGVGCYVEGTGVGPFEGATVKIDPSGKIAVAAGACPQGQGHETVFAQVAADIWRVPIEDVFVSLADTSQVTMGYGTIASRSTVTASGAILGASDKVKEKALAVAANLLETAESDLEFRDGGVGVVGVPDLHASYREIARAARPGWDNKRPERFVHQQHRGIEQQGAAQRHPLPHAARQLEGAAVLEALQPDRSDQLARPRGVPSPVEAAHVALQEHVPHHRPPIDQQVVLEHETEIGVGPAHRRAVDPDGSAGGLQKASDQGQQGALAATARSDDGNELAASDFEIGLLQRHHFRSVLSDERFPDSFDLDQRVDSGMATGHRRLSGRKRPRRRPSAAASR